MEALVLSKQEEGVKIMAYKYSDNEALHTDGLFFDAARLKMQLYIDEKGNNKGPRHFGRIRE